MFKVLPDLNSTARFIKTTKTKQYNGGVNMKCHICKNNELVQLPKDADGYSKFVCKKCNKVVYKLADNGTHIEIALPYEPESRWFLELANPAIKEKIPSLYKELTKISGAKERAEGLIFISYSKDEAEKTVQNARVFYQKHGQNAESIIVEGQKKDEKGIWRFTNK